MARGYDGIIRIGTSISTKGFNSGVKGLDGSLAGLLRTIGLIGAAIGLAFGAVAVALIAKVGASALKTAAEFLRLKLAAQQVGQMFGWSAQEITDLEKELIALGIQTDISNRAIVDFAREGLDRTLLPTLARGAQDLAMFSREGESSSDMFDRLMHGILTFNPLILRTAGVSVDLQASFEDWAAQNGKTTDSMSILEKRGVALNAVLIKLKGVTGLYEISQKTSAGQMQSNIRLMKELDGAIGMPFQNSLFAVTKGFNDLIKSLTEAIQPGGQLYWVMARLSVIVRWLSEGIIQLFGAIAAFLGIAIKPSQTVALASSNTASSLGTAANAANDLAGNLKKVASVAKGALAPFDELNVLSKPGSGDGEGGSGDVPMPSFLPNLNTKPLEDFELEFIAFKNRLAALVAQIRAFLAPLIDAFDRLVIALTPLGQTIWAGLEWAWNNIFLPLSTWAITSLLPEFLDLLGAAAAVVNSVLIALQPIWTWFWEKVLKPVAEWTGQALLDVLDWLTKRLYELSAWMDANPEVAQAIATALLVLGAAVLVVVVALNAWIAIGGIATAVTTAFGAAVAFVTSPVFLIILAIAALIAVIILIINYWPEISAAAIKVWDEIVRVWNEVAAWFQREVINPLVAFWKPVFEWIGIAANNAWAVIKLVWSKVAQWFENNIIAPIRLGFTLLWTGIQVIWTAVSTWFQTNVIDPLKAVFTPVFAWLLEKWTLIFNGIQDVVKGVVNGIIGFINGMIRGIVTGVNTIINALNSVGGSVPGWIPLPPITPPQIPLLAQGAVIPPNSRFLAMLGDQTSGKNLEAPEGLIRQIVREESGSKDITIKFAGTLGSLMRELKPYADRENQRVGSSLIRIGST